RFCCLLGWAADRRMAHPACVTPERGDRRLHGRDILRGRLVTENAGAVFEILRRSLELRPSLPDIWLGLRLRGERALREQKRDPLRVDCDRFSIHGEALLIDRLELILDIIPFHYLHHHHYHS